ncbi:MAG TPA: thioredoxin family protein [Chitinophagaceae bacterium]|jgi:thioredoxin-related protein
MSKKKLSLFFALGIYLTTAFLCPTRTIAQTIPPFKILLSDDKIFSATDLPKGKPVILVYFDPECDHCQKLMKEFFPKMNEFRKAEIIMVTFKPVDDLIAFEKLHETSKYTNIKVGTEGNTFYLRYYYGLEKMPFTALYDKNGNFVYSYKEQTPVDDLVKRFKNLK